MTYHVLDRKTYAVAALGTLNDDYSTSCEVLDFLHVCYGNKGTRSSALGMRALFALYANKGGAGLTTSMMHEANKEDSIQELIKGDIRILGFVVRETFYLTNGYIKKSQGADKQEVARAVRAKTSFLASLKK